MPALTYPSADFQPFTLIRSADVNGKFNAIKTLLNTTLLDSTNVQTRGLIPANMNLGINNALVGGTTIGTMFALTTSANQTVFTSTDGTVVVGTLPSLAGGLGFSFVSTTLNASKVVQSNPAGTMLTLDTVPQPPTSKIYSFYRFG